MSIRQGLENTRLEAEVARRTAQLTELARHMQTVREDERARLARDLHDELGALLTSARLDAARIRARLGDTAPEAQERLAHLVQTLDTVVALKRRIIEDLRPSALAHLGLAITLDILAREFGKQSGLQVHCELMATQLVPAAELTMYRLVQEALNNVAKHAGARHVWIELQAPSGEAVRLSVRDDGCGFLPGAASSASHGLAGMRFRVEAEGGSLEIHSAPGQGTQISASLPLA